MATLFISDLHLSEERTAMTALFTRFMADEAVNAETLYILGDLFDVWLGDDASPKFYQPVLQTLHNATRKNLPVYVMHGNRDFLLGDQFEAMTGCTLVGDPLVVNLYGVRTLLCHGDTLCTDDTDYQQFRSQVRNPLWQKEFLAMPPDKRLELANEYRQESRQRSQKKSREIMDVNDGAVTSAMQKHAVTRLIHGHTHRPAIHRLTLDGNAAQRIVLGDWHHHGSVLVCDANGCKLVDWT